MDDARALAVEVRREASECDQPNKALLTRIADLLDRLAAPEGVGMTRYDMAFTIDELEPIVSPEGEWVRHEDAAAALAAKEYEIKRFHEARANAPDYEVLWAEQAERAESAERALADATKRIEALEAGLDELDAWSKAYPLSVFPEPDFAKARALLEAGGMTLDAVSASNMRHVVKRVGEIARALLSPASEGNADAP